MKISKRVTNRLGKRYKSLVVISYAGLDKHKKSALWVCQCDCGAVLTIRGTCLNTQASCRKCRHIDQVTHGLTESRAYGAWCHAKVRCKPGSRWCKWYSDRGIAMCQEWSNSFHKFYEHLGNCPAGMTLERINNNIGYQPGNCRWASIKDQCNNRCSNKLITHNGTTMNLRQWSQKTGIQEGTIAYRLKVGWPVRTALDNTITISQARKITKYICQGK